MAWRERERARENVDGRADTNEGCLLRRSLVDRWDSARGKGGRALKIERWRRAKHSVPLAGRGRPLDANPGALRYVPRIMSFGTCPNVPALPRALDAGGTRQILPSCVKVVLRRRALIVEESPGYQAATTKRMGDGERTNIPELQQSRAAEKRGRIDHRISDPKSDFLFRLIEPSTTTNILGVDEWEAACCLCSFAPAGWTSTSSGKEITRVDRRLRTPSPLARQALHRSGVNSHAPRRRFWSRCCNSYREWLQSASKLAVACSRRGASACNAKAPQKRPITERTIQRLEPPIRQSTGCGLLCGFAPRSRFGSKRNTESFALIKLYNRAFLGHSRARLLPTPRSHNYAKIFGPIVYYCSAPSLHRGVSTQRRRCKSVHPSSEMSERRSDNLRVELSLPPASVAQSDSKHPQTACCVAANTKFFGCSTKSQSRTKPDKLMGVSRPRCRDEVDVRRLSHSSPLRRSITTLAYCFGNGLFRCMQLQERFLACSGARGAAASAALTRVVLRHANPRLQHSVKQQLRSPIRDCGAASMFKPQQREPRILYELAKAIARSFSLVGSWLGQPAQHYADLATTQLRSSRPRVLGRRVARIVLARARQYICMFETPVRVCSPYGAPSHRGLTTDSGPPCSDIDGSSRSQAPKCRDVGDTVSSLNAAADSEGIRGDVLVSARSLVLEMMLREREDVDRGASVLCCPKTAACSVIVSFDGAAAYAALASNLPHLISRVVLAASNSATSHENCSESRVYQAPPSSDPQIHAIDSQAASEGVGSGISQDEVDVARQGYTYREPLVRCSQGECMKAIIDPSTNTGRSSWRGRLEARFVLGQQVGEEVLKRAEQPWRRSEVIGEAKGRHVIGMDVADGARARRTSQKTEMLEDEVQRFRLPHVRRRPSSSWTPCGREHNAGATKKSSSLFSIVNKEGSKGFMVMKQDLRKAGSRLGARDAGKGEASRRLRRVSRCNPTDSGSM
ncbi:hypothetical protein B0H12DRAFT_1069029 [Mycena haematopus]|nr:hypothetical protein B0H12DRAFT_1069029 [Mycena haematopus]